MTLVKERNPRTKVTGGAKAGDQLSTGRIAQLDEEEKQDREKAARLLAGYILEARNRKEWTQERMAQELGMSRTRLADIEAMRQRNGAYSTIPFSLVFKVERVTEIKFVLR